MSWNGWWLLCTILAMVTWTAFGLWMSMSDGKGPKRAFVFVRNWLRNR